jgi:hypothetical protein
MEVIAQSIGQFRFVLIGVCLFGFTVFLVSGFLALRDLNRASFRLERSSVIGKATASWLRAALCLLAAGAVWFSTSLITRTNRGTSVALRPLLSTPTSAQIVITLIPTIAPTSIPTADLQQAAQIAQAIAQATPTTDLLAAPVVTVDPSTVLVSPTPPPEPTAAPLPTLAPQPLPAQPTQAPLAVQTVAAALNVAPTATTARSAPTNVAPTVAAPTRPAVIVTLAPPTTAPAAQPPAPQSPAVSSDCSNPDAQINSPTPGQTLSGVFDIRGRAGFNGGRYALHVLPVGETVWRFLSDSPNNVKGESLMPQGFQTSIFANGSYLLRLTIIAPSGDELRRCIVPFNIRN